MTAAIIKTYRNGAEVPVSVSLPASYGEVMRIELDRPAPLLLDYRVELLTASGQVITDYGAGTSPPAAWRLQVSQGDALLPWEYPDGDPPKAVIAKELTVQCTVPSLIYPNAVSARAWVSATPVSNLPPNYFAGVIMSALMPIGTGLMTLNMNWRDRRLPPWARQLHLLAQNGNNQWYFRPDYQVPGMGGSSFYWPGVRTYTTAQINDMPAPVPCGGFSDLQVARVTTAAAERFMILATT